MTYTPTSLTVTEDEWLTVDLPFVTGTQASGTSIFQAGTRYAVTVSGTYDYELDLKTIVFNYTGPGASDNVYLKDVEFYKSISWHVHSVKEINSQFIIFHCVRTSGRRDSRRRSYG